MDGSQLCGETIAYALHIRISKSQNRTAEKLWGTLFHELAHVVMELTGHRELLGEKQEEGVVYALEAMLAPLLTLSTRAGVRFREVPFPED